MPKISIDNAEKQQIRQAYSHLIGLYNSITAIKNEFDSFMKWVEIAPEELAQAAQEHKPVISANGYSKNFTWKQKTEYILKQSGEPVTTKEIVSKLIELEPPLGNNRAKVVGSVSSILSTKMNNEKFVKGVNERGSATYAIKE